MKLYKREKLIIIKELYHDTELKDLARGGGVNNSGEATKHEETLKELMNLERISKMKRYLICLLTMLAILSLSACKEEKTETSNDKKDEDIIMKFYIDEVEIPVTWENNVSVKELCEQVVKKDIVVEMTRYSNNEQVGPLERSYSSNDSQMTTYNGDIVLYNNSNIVVFYGSNSWSYTKLGKMNLTEREVIDLLSSKDVTIRISK